MSYLATICSPHCTVGDALVLMIGLPVAAVLAIFLLLWFFG